MSRPIEGARPSSALRHDIGVKWGDCDPARIVYTARMPWFALDAINAWWEAHLGGDGWYEMDLDRNLGTPFVHMSMDFMAPVTPRHMLQCFVWPHRLGQTSITFRVDGEQNARLCFTGEFTNVFVISDQFKKTCPPDDIRGILAPYLQQVGMET